MRAMNDGNRLAPIALAGKDPIAELEIDLAFADALFRQEVDNLFLGLRHAETVQEIRIDQLSGLHIGEAFFLDIFAAGDDLNDGQMKLFGKRPVALVMRRHGHDCARAVSHQHIVGHPHGNLPAVDRVDGVDALDLYARLVLGNFRALKVALFGSGFLVGNQRIIVGNLSLVFFNQRMLR